MTFKDLIDQSNWSDVCVALIRLVPDFHQNHQHLAMAYHELRQLEPQSGNFRLFIGQYETNELIPFYVLAFEGACRKGISLKFSDWRIWLGVNVNESLLAQYSQSEVIAICLYDMTWSAFSSEGVIKFRRTFITNQEAIEALYALIENIEASESNPVKQKQRADEVFEAAGLYDIEILRKNNESPEYCKARLEMEEQIYCLGESETDLDTYQSKCSLLREDFLRQWPVSQNKQALKH